MDIARTQIVLRSTAANGPTGDRVNPGEVFTSISINTARFLTNRRGYNVPGPVRYLRTDLIASFPFVSHVMYNDNSFL